MKTQKGNVAVMALIIVVVAITTSIITWLVVTKTQAPTVQLVATPQPAVKSAPVVQPVTVDEFADWKTYSNKTIGIEFRYPSNWPTLSLDNSGDGMKNGMLNLVDLSSLQHTFLDSDNLSIEKQYEKIQCQNNNELVVCENKVSSNGVKYVWQIEKTPGGLANNALVATGKYILVFSFQENDNYDKRANEYQKLLSTLKILK